MTRSPLFFSPFFFLPSLHAWVCNCTSAAVAADAPGLGQAQDAAGQAANKAKNAAPDLSQDPLPDSAESQSARDEVNRKTDAAPGLGSIGKNLFQNLGGSGSGSEPLVPIFV